MPTTNKLTDSQCRAMKASGTPKKIFDGGGLYLFLSAKGAKTWRMAYRLDGVPKTISFGPYPEVTLAQAREKRDSTKAAIRGGIDPMAAKRPTKTNDLSLKAAAEQYWAGRADISDGYRDNALNGIKRHLAALLLKPLRQISRDDLMEAFNVMNAAGLYVYVRKVRMWTGLVYEWAVEQTYADANPILTIHPRRAFGTAAVEHFAALAPIEVPEFLARLTMENDINSVYAVKLLALTWVRTKELRFMKWGQIEGDVWRVPAKHMKSRDAHLVPLSRQAQQIIKLMRARSRGSDYVFPHDTRLDRPMSENAVLYLIYRIGYKDRMTGHGWRSVGSTWANENGYNPDAVEMQLAHVPSNKTRAAYNRAAYMSIRQPMLQDWADWLDSCVPGGSLLG